MSAKTKQRQIIDIHYSVHSKVFKALDKQIDELWKLGLSQDEISKESIQTAKILINHLTEWCEDNTE